MLSYGVLATAALCGLPCDEYSFGDTPCVAAHSTVRALYAKYNGPLYVVKRADGVTIDIPLVRAGGAADAAVQDAFCGTQACTVIKIYDQSPFGNHLTTAPGGGAAGLPDKGTVANRSRTVVNGAPAYALYFEGGMGYRNDNTSGVATGTASQSMYMVTSGRHYNDKCCFDYGNAETDNHDHGKGTMEAIYFGNATGWGRGAGNGPWVMADLENGLWAGADKVSPMNQPVNADYVTAMVKGAAGKFALKSGDAQRGPLRLQYEGVRPPSYTPMKKEGAIILGVGGDNSDWAIGTFYEGAITRGYASNATDDAVQASIVAAGYGRM